MQFEQHMLDNKSLYVTETERLVISKIQHSHLDDLAAVLSDPEVMKYSIAGTHSKAQIAKYIEHCQQQYENQGFGQWAIHLKEHNQFVGVCGINKHQVENDTLLHINYRLRSTQQGKGFATEATASVIDYCKNTLNLNEIATLIDPRNKPSLKVAKKTGFTFKKSSNIQGFLVDIYHKKLTS